VFLAIMITGARGRSLLREHYASQSEPTATFLDSMARRVDHRLPGLAVVMTATAESIPPVLLNVVRRFRVLHRTVLLTTVTTEEVPHVTGERVAIEPLGSGLHRVTLRYGFMDEPKVHQALSAVVPEFDANTPLDAVTYVFGHERIIPSRAGRMGVIAETIFAALSRNAANPSDFFDLPPAQVVEVGGRIDL
jgi:KUP system potassium uptake protein